MSKKIVLSLCDLTTKITIPWAEAGYECICCDIQHKGVSKTGYPSGGSIIKIEQNIFDYRLENDYKIIFAFPPCTHLAVSGSRWMKAKGLPAVIEALTLVNKCRELCEQSGAQYMIENPVSTLSTYWRKPDYKFDPYQYGGYKGGEDDAYTKKTCLWTGNGFIMPEPKPIEPIMGSKMHLMGPSPERANLRAATPMGFAQAVFEANELRNGQDE